VICDNSRIFSTTFTCDLHEKDVHIEWNPAPLQLPEDMHNYVLAHWDSLPKDYIFNGRLARLDSWSLTSAHCQLDLRPTDYRTLLYSNSHIDLIQKKWGRPFLARTLGISSIVLSSDNELIFMKRSANVGEYPECYDVFGGHIDVPTDGSAPNVFASMAQELQEEVGLERSDYDLKLIGLIQSTPNLKPELIFIAQTNVSTQHILTRTRDAQDHIEFSQVHTIGKNKSQIIQFLNANRDEFSPSAFGSFCVYMSAF
jgi:8-oxo-dGTP pyrophosphatase MutT (NUDIX family)